MSIQPSRPMLAALQETLRKLENSQESETAEIADLKRILRRRISDVAAIQRPLSGRGGQR